MKERRGYYIYKEVFRLRTIRILLGLLLAILVVLILLGLSLFYWVPAGEALFSQGGAQSSAAIYVTLIGKVLLVIAVVLSILLGWSLYMIGSRFLGPLHRITEDMEKLLEGDFEELKFRKDDEWEFHSLASYINELIDELRFYRKMGGEIKEIKKKIEKQELPPEEIVSRVNEIKCKPERSI